ncbi:SDR family oxidoreductase [Lichenihabitans sp. PAMC28606]|uniref:SDR family NAD(P)-dependent oxidoreductase n=1 Tax=Lichenihabitans sp. PAMC28606 TaxID=2880932 RepID=UPI001D0B72D1|nr:SDR family oxidoreductase [Lichenihabitans sp. PAMC28606]UDL92992.1 SDR family oxidoreductase [Lichenihabitans sp. PAMC28606]
MEPILIVGGAGGIGSAIARRLTQRGETVVLIGRDAAKLEAVGQELGVTTRQLDVTDAGAVQSTITDIISAGPIKGLVYAVGTITVKPLQSLTTAEFDIDFRANALGAALTIQAAAPALKAAHGDASIVLFSSVAATQGFSGHASIGMAKAAVEGLARSLATELAPKVRVNCIAPSLTRTPLAAPLTRNEALAKAVADLHALRRLGEPDDIAALAAFLLSEDAGWITGQVIGVDGGRSTLRTKG